MRQSRFFIDTLREVPADADVISQQLMMRASMIKKVATGIYTYLPLGLRVIRKVEKIVRDVMNESGAIELLMPAVQPAELWIESGRWNYYGKELLRVKDRHNRDFCIGPTHEEVITDIVRNSIKSYKQMPINFYQIQTKFRDEVRPRFGLMRGREFIMKDAYSFDISDEEAEASYQIMYKAYQKIFERCGLKYKIVDADSGAIGGSFSHEFMVTADTGEDAVISCNKCAYSANIEKAVVTYKNRTDQIATKLQLEKVHTPDAHTVDDVVRFLKTDIRSVVKTMIINADTKLYAILIRGDHELNLAKVKNFIGATICELATADEIISSTKGAVGFSGPIGLTIPIYADNILQEMANFVVGANEKDMHFINANLDDFKIDNLADFRNAVAGDNCPKCDTGIYEITRGIEVGHIFKLGTKYSDKLNATYLDKFGKKQVIVMGCYGIGIGRTAAASIEQNNDAKGIIWPKAIAPFEVVVVPMNSNDEEVVKVADRIYETLLSSGVDVIIDDRDERAGVKMIDAELIGYPIKISVGKKSLLDGNVEITDRTDGIIVTSKCDDAVAKVLQLLKVMK